MTPCRRGEQTFSTQTTLPFEVPRTRGTWADRAASLWIGLGALLLLLARCSAPQHKGQACLRELDCETPLKCLHQRCADGLLDSPCRTDNDCQTSAGFFCDRTERCTLRPPNEIPETGDEQEKNTEATPETTEEIAPEPVLSCRTSRLCPPSQLCFPTPDGRDSRCQSTPRPCVREDDCRTSPHTACRLLEQRDGTLHPYCIPPYPSVASEQSAGASCEQSAQCLSGICLLPFFRRCGGFCQQDTDCPTGFFCGRYSFGEQGEFSGCWPLCQSNGDCPQDYLCLSQGRCQPQSPARWGGACTQRADCPAFATCRSTWPGGLCSRTCTPVSRSCAPQDPPCLADHICTQDPFSGQFLCTPNCPAATRCTFIAPQQALCLPTCQADRDCRSEYACNALGFCIPRGQGQIGDLCERDQDCSSAQCRLFPNGRYCTISCEQDCPARFFCRRSSSQQGGWCERLCDIDAECSEQGYRCRSLRCELASLPPLPDGSACQSDTQCQSGRCWLHPLFPNGLCARACRSQTDCAGGFLCRSLDPNQRLCLPTCSPRSPCARSTYACLSVPLLEDSQTARPLPCFGDADCPSTKIADVTSFCARDDQQSLCSVGVCVGRGNLRVGSLCAHSLDCETGLCVFPHRLGGSVISCQQDRDCPVATPRCHPSQRRCVGCLSSVDCSVASPLCREGACTALGYCAQICSASCPAHTACAKRRDPANSPLPDACLPRCSGTIQCSQGFFCRSDENNPSACHPTAP
ncbi:hypothetical protein L6R29_12050 [Myxococcota bacterium]|nr:hypothetical protein [Myxococcota bacterium]